MELVQDIYVAYAFVHLEAKLNWCHMNRANTKTKTFTILMCNSIILNVQIFFFTIGTNGICQSLNEGKAT